MTVTLTREEAQQVLDALETSAFHLQNHCDVGVDEQLETIKKTQLQAENLRARLAQPEPPCKTGSQCIGGKCPQCVVEEDRESLRTTIENQRQTLQLAHEKARDSLRASLWRKRQPGAGEGGE